MTDRTFIKMHGLGNDFVIMDARRQAIAPTAEEVRAIADRRTGIGFDQFITIEPASDEHADAFMRIRNADGGEVEACGNAARCVASRLIAERGTDAVTIQTVAGRLRAQEASGGRIAVDMGPARTDWRDIPLAEPIDTAHLPVDAGMLANGVAVNVGNPHAVFFVDNAERVDLEREGPAIERLPLFPERTNVEAVQVLGRDRLRLRVWERGVGITRACGSGACAAAVAAHRRGLSDRSVSVILDGGELDVTWSDDGHVLMTGPVATSFEGRLSVSWQT